MNTYIRLLFEQFKQAEGIKSFNEETKLFMIDIICWIKEREKIGQEYLYLLNELDIPFEYRDCAEIGKTYLDSAVKNFGTTIITPYINGFEKDRVIEGQFEVFESKPTIIIPKEQERKIISSQAIRNFITHNPYSEESIATWHHLHNSRNGNIAVTVFGKTYDKDIDSKIKMLKSLKDKLEYPSQEVYETIQDNYFYIVGSKPKTKQLHKVLEK